MLLWKARIDWLINEFKPYFKSVFETETLELASWYFPTNPSLTAITLSPMQDRCMWIMCMLLACVHISCFVALAKFKESTYQQFVLLCSSRSFNAPLFKVGTSCSYERTRDSPLGVYWIKLLLLWTTETVNKPSTLCQGTKNPLETVRVKFIQILKLVIGCVWHQKSNCGGQKMNHLKRRIEFCPEDLKETFSQMFC